MLATVIHFLVRFMLPKYISESTFNSTMTTIKDHNDDEQHAFTTDDVKNCSEVNEIEFYLQDNVGSNHLLQHEQHRTPSPHTKKTAREEYEERFAKKSERKMNSTQVAMTTETNSHFCIYSRSRIYSNLT